MTADRLAELARKATDAMRNGGEIHDTADLADLARCARGWAIFYKLKGQISMEHTLPCYFWRNEDGRGDYTVAPTALEAVEAAEVGK